MSILRRTGGIKVKMITLPESEDVYQEILVYLKLQICNSCIKYVQSVAEMCIMHIK